MAALFFVDMHTEVDVEAIVSSKDETQTFTADQGKSASAGAIRLATARALTSFVSLEWQEKMRLAGLLTRDPRNRERKKVGRYKARKKHAW